MFYEKLAESKEEKRKKHIQNVKQSVPIAAGILSPIALDHYLGKHSTEAIYNASLTKMTEELYDKAADTNTNFGMPDANYHIDELTKQLKRERVKRLGMRAAAGGGLGLGGAVYLRNMYNQRKQQEQES
jgi:hypothetical protein